MACFQELRIFPLCQMLLKIWNRYWNEILGSCFKNSYGISSGWGVVLWDFLKEVFSSAMVNGWLYYLSESLFFFFLLICYFEIFDWGFWMKSFGKRFLLGSLLVAFVWSFIRCCRGVLLFLPNIFFNHILYCFGLCAGVYFWCKVFPSFSFWFFNCSSRSGSVIF